MENSWMANEPVHENSNNVVSATSKGSWLRPACAYVQSDQSLCKSLEYSMSFKLLTEHHLEFLNLLNRRLHRLVWVYNCQNATLLEIKCHGSNGIHSYQTAQSDLGLQWLNMHICSNIERKYRTIVYCSSDCAYTVVDSKENRKQ